jgi:hypothetical protein
MRHRIERVFSEITSWFPKRIHAVTVEGFLLKATLFIFAFALSKVCFCLEQSFYLASRVM